MTLLIDFPLMKVLNIMFPNPELVETEGLNVRVQAILLEDIDWKFQSSLEGFKSFPSKPLKVHP